MKELLFIVLTTMLLSCTYNAYSQEIPEGEMIIDENTIIKDESGKKVEIFKLMELLNSGEWMMDPVKDKKEKLLYMQLRKATDEERKTMSEMPKQLNSSNLIGESAPDFKFIDINGNTMSSETTKGKIVVLNFWFTACKPCIAEIPELNEVYEKFKNDTNVVFASITFDKKEKVAAFLKEHSISYPVVSDAKKTCDLFKISGYPTNIVIDKDGNYYDSVSGGFPEIGSQISNSITNALKGKEALLNPIPSDNMIIDPNSTFKLENGEIVTFEKALEMLNNNKHDIILKKEDNEKEYYLIKER